MVSDKENEIKKYKKAAKRHLDTCRYMLHYLDNVKQENTKNNILIDIYYLSGYIIECAGSLGMIHLDKPLPNIHNFQHNLIPSLFKHNLIPKNKGEKCLGHCLSNLLELIENPSTEHSIEDSLLKSTFSLYKIWNTKFRYEELTLSKESVEGFYNLSKDLYNCIAIKIEGR